MLSQYLLLDRDSGFVVISVRMHADRQTDRQTVCACPSHHDTVLRNQSAR